MNIRIDGVRLLESLGKIGGAALVVCVLACGLAVESLLNSKNTILSVMGMAPAIIIIPLSLILFSRRPRIEALKNIGNLPPEILKYVEHFPAFASQPDLLAGFVRTSADSFMFLSREILKGLKRGMTINATDRLMLSEVGDEYWHSDGISYLESNFDAVRRGVKINRYFIVPEADFEDHNDVLQHVIAINERCGVSTFTVKYEELPPQQRREFALFGNLFCDDATYDIFGHHIIENRIYFRREKHTEFSELVRALAHRAVRHQPNVIAADEFSEIAAYARQVRTELSAKRALQARAAPAMLPAPSSQ